MTPFLLRDEYLSAKPYTKLFDSRNLGWVELGNLSFLIYVSLLPYSSLSVISMDNFFIKKTLIIMEVSVQDGGSLL